MEYFALQSNLLLAAVGQHAYCHHLAVWLHLMTVTQ